MWKTWPLMIAVIAVFLVACTPENLPPGVLEAVERAGRGRGATAPIPLKREPTALLALASAGGQAGERADVEAAAGQDVALLVAAEAVQGEGHQRHHKDGAGDDQHQAEHERPRLHAIGERDRGRHARSSTDHRSITHRGTSAAHCAYA
mgnify:CR=1 FL=1